MDSLIQKIKAARARFSPHETYERQGIRPARDWMIVFICMFVALGLAAAAAFYFYTRIDQGVLFSVPETSTQQTVTLNAALLKKAVQASVDRANTLQLLEQTPPQIPDPSR